MNKGRNRRPYFDGQQLENVAPSLCSAAENEWFADVVCHGLLFGGK